jgi:hypothetical protein
MGKWCKQWTAQAICLRSAFGAWVTDVIRWKKGED